jgi:hypothetical protein
MECNEGETCDRDTWLCEPELECPCFTEAELLYNRASFLHANASCHIVVGGFQLHGREGTYPEYTNTTEASAHGDTCVRKLCGLDGQGCDDTVTGSVSPGSGDIEITEEEYGVCLALVVKQIEEIGFLCTGR